MIRSIHSRKKHGLMIFMAAVFMAAIVMPAAARAEGVTVATADELLQELNNHTGVITLGAHISTSGSITIGYPVKIEKDSFSWTHSGLLIFTDKDYNSVLDDVSKGAGFFVRYRSTVTMITGAATGETVETIKYVDGSIDNRSDAEASNIVEGGFTANFRGNQKDSWRNVLEVAGLVTNGGTYRTGTQKHVLSREYSITYKSAIVGEEIEILDSNVATSYTADDQTVILPTKVSLKGYKLKFLGWSLADGSTEVIKDIPAGSTGDLVFYANFEEDPSQGGGMPGGWGGHSFGGLSGLLSSVGTDAEESAAAEQAQASAGQTESFGNGRRVATGKSKTEIVFSDESSGKLDLDGVINNVPKQDHTKQLLILGIGLVAVATIGIVTLLKKKR